MEDNEPRYVPYAKDPWNEIVPGLFQGGQVTADHWTDGSWVAVGSEFGAVFSFYWGGPQDKVFGPDPAIDHFYYQIPDGVLARTELEDVRIYARNVAALVRCGLKILVRCQAGYNRSGLVVAFALMELGYSAQEAIDLIREKRSQYALHRPVFLQYIREAEGEVG